MRNRKWEGEGGAEGAEKGEEKSMMLGTQVHFYLVCLKNGSTSATESSTEPVHVCLTESLFAA